MILGYARVSTDDQLLDAQEDALTAAGAERIFSDKITGSSRSRPELDRMIQQLRDGDVVVVTKYDRLSRSLKDLLEIVEAIRAQGAGFRSLAEDIDTTTPAGRLVFHVFASIAQFERERISERTKEGLAAARKRGRVGGRPPARDRATLPRQREDDPAGLGLFHCRSRVSVRVTLCHEPARLRASRRTGRSATRLFKDGRVRAPLTMGVGHISPADRTAVMTAAT